MIVVDGTPCYGRGKHVFAAAGYPPPSSPPAGSKGASKLRGTCRKQREVAFSSNLFEDNKKPGLNRSPRPPSRKHPNAFVLVFTIGYLTLAAIRDNR